MDAVIERRSPVHYFATLNGREVGTFATLQAARDGIVRAMHDWYGLVPA
jgi:hypothetical protein